MKKFIILIPLFNDWKSISKLLDKIDLETLNWAVSVSILLINDASTEERCGLNFNFKKIELVKILNMKKNTVHQRCIAAGLKYIMKNEDFDHVIIMDADGEDRPEELNDFFKKAKDKPNIVITANRFKRSEGFVFRALYEVHKLLTLIFAGKLIKFGNFTCLSKDHVNKLIQKSFLWNSYSASVVRTFSKRESIKSIRGSRYFGPSKMNFKALVLHSLGIISVFRKVVIIRSTIFLAAYLFFIFNNVSIFSFIPILFLFLFVFTILKLSMRSNMKEFNNSLDNIESINILDNSNSR